MNWTKIFYLNYLVAAFLLSGCEEADRGEVRPNIIFILADDLGWADVGFNGARYYETPNLDKLAGRGIRFTHAYANAANCAPTRASILTGQYTSRHGIVTVGASDRGDRKAQSLIPVANREVLDTATFSMGKMLQTAGYHTAFIGKWHLGDHRAFSPLAHGFDHTVAGWQRGSPKSYFSPYQNPALTDGPEGEHLTDRLTDEAIRYIQQRRATGQPFFLYLSYYAVHAPFQAKDSLIEKYRQKQPHTPGRSDPVYAAMIETMDDNIGRLHRLLESEGLMDNTRLVFWSDNGGSFRATVNTPLKGAKGMPYEGGLRVPAFVYAPGFYSQPAVVEEPVISTDLFPTFAGWAGAAIPDDASLAGIDLAPLLKRAPWAERPLFWYAPVYLPGSDGYAFRMTPSAVMRKGDHKLIWWYASGKTALYNLSNDLAEAHDLSQQHPELAAQLFEELQAWHKAGGVKIPALCNPEFDSLYAAEKYKSIQYE